MGVHNLAFGDLNDDDDFDRIRDNLEKESSCDLSDTLSLSPLYIILQYF